MPLPHWFPRSPSIPSYKMCDMVPCVSTGLTFVTQHCLRFCASSLYLPLVARSSHLLSGCPCIIKLSWTSKDHVALETLLHTILLKNEGFVLLYIYPICAYCFCYSVESNRIIADYFHILSLFISVKLFSFISPSKNVQHLEFLLSSVPNLLKSTFTFLIIY